VRGGQVTSPTFVPFWTVPPPATGMGFTKVADYHV